MSSRIDLVGHREEAEKFYTTDPEYLEAAAEVREILWGIHDRVVALDIEGTLACTEIGSWFGRRVEFHDRVRRPLSNEFARALIEGGNQVVVWTGLGASSAYSVMFSAGLEIFKKSLLYIQDLPNLPTVKGGDFKISDQAEFVGHADLRGVLFMLAQQGHSFAKRVNQLACSRSGGDSLPPSELARTGYANFKIPSVLGADVLVDDTADFFRSYGTELYGPKEAARYLAVKSFCVSSESDPLGYLRSDRALLEIARKLPGTLAEIDSLQDISIEELRQRADKQERARVLAEKRRLARKAAPVRTAISDFGKKLLRLLGGSGRGKGI
ncbi:MAG: hypothetical protein WC604_03755 [Candidatus Gracilibacteria bacterium]